MLFECVCVCVCSKTIVRINLQQCNDYTLYILLKGSGHLGLLLEVNPSPRLFGRWLQTEIGNTTGG
jgi:hypothetical protein